MSGKIKDEAIKSFRKNSPKGKLKGKYNFNEFNDYILGFEKGVEYGCELFEKEIIQLKEALRDMSDALSNWLEWEMNQVQKDGRYVGEEINLLIDCGDAALAKHSELLNRIKE